MPLGQVDLPVTFGDSSNFRTETLTFEVVDFPRSYHAILGRPCYTKFMAVPNYTYLKLKMPRPKGVIIVGASFRVAYMCDQTCVELASAIMATAELANFHKEVSESPPPDSNKSKAVVSFKSAEDTREVSIDPNDHVKWVRIGTVLSPA